MDFLTEWGMVAGVAGMALGVFLVLFREVIRKRIFSQLTKRQSYQVVIAFMLLVWTLSGFSIYQYFYDGGDAPATLTVLVHGEGGRGQRVLPGRGQVSLVYGDAIVSETINGKGEATFKQVPASFFEAEAGVEVLFHDPGGEPYRAVHGDSLYRLTRGRYLPLEVRLVGLGRIRGIVKDQGTGEPLDSVRVGILGLHTYTNAYGEYVLDIPKGMQRQFQTLRAYRRGYEPRELKDLAVQAQREIPILMRPSQ